MFCINIVAIFWVSSNSEAKCRDTVAKAANEQTWGIIEGMGHGEGVLWLGAYPEGL